MKQARVQQHECEAELGPGNKGAHNELIATIWLLKQGYYVFRNVSPHGPVDIIAMKGGEMHLFDVKFGSVRANGEKIVRIILKPQQVALGVKGLAVFPDGSCEIDSDGSVAAPFSPLRACVKCSTEFQPRRLSQIYCNRSCGLAHRKIVRGEVNDCQVQAS